MSTPTLIENEPRAGATVPASATGQTTPLTMIDSTSPADGAVAEKQEQPMPGKHELHESDKYVHPLAKLSQIRKNILLFVFSIAVFTDICNVSGVGVAVAQISADIKLGSSQVVWIITSYSLTFASFLLFAGRLSDLFPAQLVFEGGFAALGIISLVTSFVTSNKYGFLILRGIGGICGAMTVPSSYHLAVHMFPEPAEQQAKLAMLGMAGAIGNVLGLLLAGATMEASYKWFFRLVCILCLVFTAICVVLLPWTGSSYAESGETDPRWKRLDIVGVVLLMGALICFILGLTQGPIDGWNAASFIAPFVLSFPLFVSFFAWESWVQPKFAVLPASVWKITNIIVSSLVCLGPFAVWATSQLQYANYWQFSPYFEWSPIHVAVAILPQGIIALLVGGVVSAAFPKVISTPRITIPVAAVLIIAGELLQIFSDAGVGNKGYWRYCFPGFLLISAGAVIMFFASGVNLITYCPPEMAGVAGAWVQVCAQIGGAICLAVQAGLDGDYLHWKQSGARSFYFMIGWIAMLAIQFVVFYKKPGTNEEEHEAARQRIREAGKEIGTTV